MLEMAAMAVTAAMGEPLEARDSFLLDVTSIQLQLHPGLLLLTLAVFLGCSPVELDGGLLEPRRCDCGVSASIGSVVCLQFACQVLSGEADLWMH